MSYGEVANSLEQKKNWDAIRSEVDKAIRAGWTLTEFFESQGWVNRESWYRMKPTGFNWGKIQKELGVQRKKKTKKKKKKKLNEKKLNEMNLKDMKLNENTWLNLGELQGKQHKDYTEDERRQYNRLYQTKRAEILKKFRCKSVTEIKEKYKVDSLEDLVERKIMPFHVVYEKEKQANAIIPKAPEQKEKRQLKIPVVVEEIPVEKVQQPPVKITFEGDPTVIKSMLKEMFNQL
jgi:hypothetical protein